MKRGVWRVWIVATVAWVAWLAWQSDLACPLRAIGIDAGGGPWCESQLADPLAYFGGLVLKMIMPPLLAAIGIVAAFWIAAGFRKA